MNFDLLLAFIFYVFLFLFFLRNRHKFEIQNKIIALYKTKLGLKLMDKISLKFPKILKFMSYCSIVIGFVGMGFIFYFLIKGTWNLIFVPEAVPILSPVLPGIKIPGLPVLSFIYWIISILIVAFVHEFSHGIYARLNNIKIKSSGFAFLGPILAAFVEPDEEQLQKKSRHSQLSVLSAGPFSNILFAVILILISLLFSPVANSIIEFEGVRIVSIDKSLPISSSGLKEGDIIEKINDIPIGNQDDFIKTIDTFSPGEKIKVTSNSKEHLVTLSQNPQQKSKPVMGVGITSVSVKIKQDVLDKYGVLPKIFMWLMRLLFWLYVISFGIGLFNLLPLWIVDGGRMFYLLLTKFTTKEKSIKIWNFVSLFCLLLIFINLLPYMIKLLKFIFMPLLLLF